MTVNMAKNHYPENIMQEIADIETLSQALQVYEAVEMPARGWAAKTRTEYTNDLAGLLEFLEGRGVKQPKQVKLEHLRGYQAELERRGLAASSRQRKTYAIKGFFGFLAEYQLVADNLADKLIPPKVPKKEPRFLTEQEYKALVRACSHHPRDAAIVELLLQTGMRLGELVRLSLDDIELPQRITKAPENVGFVTVTRKGGDTVTIPLNYKACQALKTWLKVRPQVDTDALFVTKFRKSMGRRAVYRAVKKYLKEAGIKNATVHTIRHTFGTHHVAQGTDLKTVQETMGHADIATTALYVHLAKKAQRKALQEHAL
jgi:site-specific recombinase XerD